MKFIKIPNKNFEMQIHQVTQKDWQKVMNNNPSHFKGPLNPVEKVSWLDAQEFIKKINAEDAKYNYRLPKEKEWEYCCGPEINGSQLKDYAWHSDNSNAKTHPVGQKEPNIFGLYDMLGNVWEWCEDFYDPRNQSRDTKLGKMLLGISSNATRVIKGGSWVNVAQNLRPAYRYGDDPDDRSSGVGFRLLRTLK